MKYTLRIRAALLSAVLCTSVVGCASYTLDEAMGDLGTVANIATLGIFTYGTARGYNLPAPNLPSPGSTSFATNTPRAGTPSSVTASSCTPLPPRCAAADSNAMNAASRIVSQAGLRGAAEEYYCATRIGVELNRFCAHEFRRDGRPHCAALHERQAEEFLRASQQAARTVASSSNINAMNARCQVRT